MKNLLGWWSAAVGGGLGVATSLGVAVAFSSLPERGLTNPWLANPEYFVLGDAGDRLVVLGRAVGVSEYQINAVHAGRVWSGGGCFIETINPKEYQRGEEKLPAWVRAQQFSDGAGQRNLAAFGWPARVLWCGLEYREGQRFAVASPISSVAAFQSAASLSWWSGRLPIGVLWGGMAVNSTVYGAAWLCGIVGVRGLRRWRRRRRGLCSSCAYDLRGALSDVCPECGGARRELPERHP